MDLSLNYNFHIGRMESSLNLSIYNVYNRHNAFAVYFRDTGLSWNSDSEQTGSGVEVVKLYLFPIIPTITFNIKF
jgi:hypothetical protein